MTDTARDISALASDGAARGGSVVADDTDHAVPRTDLSAVAGELTGSLILTIAAEVRALANTGKPLCNLTVGDFSPSEFTIPTSLLERLVAALRAGQTNYPPSDGTEQLRNAIRAFYARRLKLDYPFGSVLVTSGARPAIYGAYRVLVDPGDTVLYPVPSWNNNYYCQLLGAKPLTVTCGAETNFMPTAEQLRPLVKRAQMLVLNSPLNPTGTVFDPEGLGEICDLVLEENARRARVGADRPLYLLYDQVYWMLTFGDVVHVNPVSLRPEIEPYTVLVDAISKSFAATGLRVGWAVGPTRLIKPMSNVIGHVGAWAPRPEQIATAALLNDDGAIDAFHAQMLPQVRKRLDLLSSGINALRAEGFPVEATTPQGAIYLSARFAIAGRRTPQGDRLRTNEDVRRYLLQTAGLAAVQFQAFGSDEDTGWFRLSVGAVSPAAIEALMPRVRSALSELE
jgi:aspartate aminotransferase